MGLEGRSEGGGQESGGPVVVWQKQRAFEIEIHITTLVPLWQLDLMPWLRRAWFLRVSIFEFLREISSSFRCRRKYLAKQRKAVYLNLLRDSFQSLGLLFWRAQSTRQSSGAQNSASKLPQTSSTVCLASISQTLRQISILNPTFPERRNTFIPSICPDNYPIPICQTQYCYCRQMAEPQDIRYMQQECWHSGGKWLGLCLTCHREKIALCEKCNENTMHIDTDSGEKCMKCAQALIGKNGNAASPKEMMEFFVVLITGLAISVMVYAL